MSLKPNKKDLVNQITDIYNSEYNGISSSPTLELCLYDARSSHGPVQV